MGAEYFVYRYFSDGDEDMRWPHEDGDRFAVDMLDFERPDEELWGAHGFETIEEAVAAATSNAGRLVAWVQHYDAGTGGYEMIGYPLPRAA